MERQFADPPEGSITLTMDFLELLPGTGCQFPVRSNAFTAFGSPNMDPRKSQIVELRTFGGLNNEETAEALGLRADRHPRSAVRERLAPA